MTTILIARHGNTFDKGDRVVRVGCKTDLPLSSSGKDQAVLLGKYLQEHNLKLAAVFTSTLKRTQETAQLMLERAGQSLKIDKLDIFNEIDYGIDEGKTDEEIIARIGTEALHAWDKKGIVPPGWSIDPQEIIANWQHFASRVLEQYPKQTIMVVTSNGIARFAPYLTGDFSGFCTTNSVKIGTGCVCALSYIDGTWQVEYWNQKPG